MKKLFILATATVTLLAFTACGTQTTLPKTQNEEPVKIVRIESSEIVKNLPAPTATTTPQPTSTPTAQPSESPLPSESPSPTKSAETAGKKIVMENWSATIKVER